MTPPTLFLLALRLLGLVVLYRAIAIAPDVLIHISNVWFGSPWVTCLNPLIHLATHTAAALWLIRGASPLARWAYPNSPD